MKNKLMTVTAMAIAFGLVQFGTGTGFAAQEGQYGHPPSPQQQQSPQSHTKPNRKQPQSQSPQNRTKQVFIGTIQKNNGKYVLSEAALTYKLDNQSKAAKFNNQRVQVTGLLATNGHVIHVQKISPQPLKQSRIGQQYPRTPNPAQTRTEQFFIGTVQKRNGNYVLSQTGHTYKLDKQSEAAKFKNQQVQVKGTLALNGHTIYVQHIEPLRSSS